MKKAYLFLCLLACTGNKATLGAQCVAAADCSTGMFCNAGVCDSAACVDDNACKEPAMSGATEMTVTQVSASGSEDGPVTIALPAGGTLGSVDLKGHGGALTLAGSTASYDPQGAFNALAPGQATVITIAFTVDAAPFVATLTLAGSNDVPRVDDTKLTAIANTRDPLALHLLDVFTDVDAGDTVTLTAVAACPSATAALADNTVTFTSSAIGVCVVDVTASDSFGGHVTAHLTVTVRAPVITSFAFSEFLFGRSTMLSWAASAGTCTLSSGGNALGNGATGSASFTPPALVVTATLTCVPADGPTEMRDLTVEAVPGYFVKPGGSGNGLSWDSALPQLQDAITAAAGDPLTIYVAGTQYSVGGNPVAVLTPGLQLVGGFSTSATGTTTSRTLNTYGLVTTPSVLSGATGSADADLAGNAQHVVVAADDSSLDGFAVTAGYATADFCGAGVLVGNAKNVRLHDVDVHDNTAAPVSSLAIGAGIYVGANGSVSLTDCAVQSNSALGASGGGYAFGGGIAVESGGSVTVTGQATHLSDIGGNRAQGGAGGGAGGDGGNGAGGGIFCNQGNVTLAYANVSGNVARGGNGLAGATPPAATPGPGGDGGDGGIAGGAGILLSGCTFASTALTHLDENNAISGKGGAGADASTPTNTAYHGGNGGNGGNVPGAGMYVLGASGVSFANLSFYHSQAFASPGGHGGAATASGAGHSANGGNGGDSGQIYGATIYVEPSGSAISLPITSVNPSSQYAPSSGGGGAGAGTTGLIGNGGIAYTSNGTECYDVCGTLLAPFPTCTGVGNTGQSGPYYCAP